MALIEVSNVSKSVRSGGEPLHILDNINLRIELGESVAITGISGSGKSTLLGLLAGLDQPSSGSISHNGINLSGLGEDDLAALRADNMGFIFQSFQLVPVLSALDNVALPLTLGGVASATANERARELLTTVGLAERLTHYPSALSGGEQQRVAIARAFIKQPPILFADEPTGNLDAKTSDQIADLLFDLNAQNATTLILVTHDLDLAQRCDRHVVMHAGVLSEQDSPRVAK